MAHDFDWVDVLLRRWQIWVAVVGAIVWATTMQIQLTIASEKIVKFDSQISDLSDIRAGWPYLKVQVDRIEDKVDQLLSK